MDPLSRGNGRSSILLVDDRSDNLTTLKAVLEPLGQEVVAVGSGHEALERLSEEDFALVVLDVHMPVLDGFETARLIRERDKTKQLPIVFLTAAYQDAESIKRGFEFGAVDYFTKPFDPDILRAKVKALVELSQADARLNERIRKLEDQSGRLRQVVASLEGPAYHAQEVQDQRATVADLHEANRLRTELLGVVAHEFRTPLGVISGMTQTLLGGEDMDVDQRRRAHEAIARQARRLTSLVESLLDTNRTFEPRPGSAAHVASIAASAISWVGESYLGRTIPVLASIPDDAETAIDQTALHMILVNLIGNAVKFALPGTSVTVEAGIYGSRVRILVTNVVMETLSDQEREDIFKPFVKLERDSRISSGGVGLGLHIVRRFTDLYKGTVSASCTEDTVTFTVDLPRAAVRDNPAIVDLTEANVSSS